MSNNDEQIDAVRMMREIRDRLSKQIKGMTFEEQKRFIEKQLARKSKQTKGDNDESCAA